MKKMKRLLIFTLASALAASNVAYAAPARGEQAESDAADIISFENSEKDIKNILSENEESFSSEETAEQIQDSTNQMSDSSNRESETDGEEVKADQEETKEQTEAASIDEDGFVESPDNEKSGSSRESDGTETAAVPAKIAADMLNRNSVGAKQIEVTVVDENNNVIEGVQNTVPEGVCENIAPRIDGYDFVNATVNSDEIYEVGSFNNIVYYVPADDHNTGLLLGNSAIVFHYETHLEKYSISYNTDPDVRIEGPYEVKEGNDYSFTAVPGGKGKRLSVTVNNEDYSDQGVLVDSSSGLTRYTVEKVQEDQQIVVTETDISSYRFSYNNSNIRQGKVISPADNTCIEAGSSITFQVISNVGGGLAGNLWHLNLLAINGEYINVPADFSPGAAAETILSSGEKVTVTLKDDRYDIDWWQINQYCYQYDVTVTDVYTDITLTDGNFKNADRNEIILKRLDGVSDIIGWDYASRRPNNQKGAYVEGTINSVYQQTESTGNEFYFNLKPGYTDPDVTVLADGKETGITVTRVEDMNPSDITAEGYEYQFNIPNHLSDNVEVYIASDVKTYTIQYEVDGVISEEITDNGSYTIFPQNNNETFIKGEPAYDTSKYIFTGWQYNNRTYQPNDLFVFNEDSVQGADENNIITLKARFDKIEDGKYVPYTIEYLFQTQDKDYGQRPDYANKTGYGMRDSLLFSYDVLTWKIEGYVLNLAKSDIVLALNSDSRNVAAIYFDLDRNNNNIPDDKETKYGLYYDANGGKGTPENVPDMYLRGQTATLDSYITPTRDGMVFIGWSEMRIEEALTAEPEEGMLVTNVIFGEEDKTVYAVWASDENHNGKPDFSEDLVTIIFDTIDTAKGYFDKGAQTIETVLLPGTELTTPEGFTDVKDDDYLFEGWTDAEGRAVTVVPENDAAVMAKWAEDKNHNGIPDDTESFSVVISYAYAEGEEGEAVLPEAYTETDFPVGAAYSVASPVIMGYVAVPLTVEGTITDYDVTEEVLYYIDANENGIPDRQEPEDPEPAPEPEDPEPAPEPEDPEPAPEPEDPEPAPEPEDPEPAPEPEDPEPVPEPEDPEPTLELEDPEPEEPQLTDTLKPVITALEQTAEETERETVNLTAQDEQLPDNSADSDTSVSREYYSLSVVGIEAGSEYLTRVNEDDVPKGNRPDLKDADNEERDDMTCILHWPLFMSAVFAAILFMIDGSRRKKRIEKLKQEIEEIKKGRSWR